MQAPHSVSASRLAGLVALISAGALLSACAQPAPQESAYQLWNYYPPVATPAYYPQRQQPIYSTPDYGDTVIPTPASPAPAPAPPPEQKTAEAQPAPAPVAPPADLRLLAARLRRPLAVMSKTDDDE
jgi:hypothetical protein